MKSLMIFLAVTAVSCSSEDGLKQCLDGGEFKAEYKPTQMTTIFQAH